MDPLLRLFATNIKKLVNLMSPARTERNDASAVAVQ